MKDMKIKDIVMKVIDVLYNIIVGVLTILAKVIVFLITFAQSNSIAKSKSAVKFIFSDVKVNTKPNSNVEPTIDVEFEVVETKSKRQELEDSLRYLKSKVNKTVQDKNSIGVIEAVLKNM
jgi:TolA-binding protein